ncbi:MAG: DUF393 domain-containing protein [Bacteroidales bacterium]|nr:DUF393 domain-containing protein [Bacteroidales bacterium]
MESNHRNDHAIILFDGVCNLCNWFVRFVIRHDKSGYFKFFAVSSDAAKDLLAGFDVGKMIGENTDSVVLLEEEKVYIKSDAVGKIVEKLNHFSWISVIYKLFPVIMKDWIYDFVAKRRYRWFGKKESCMIPTPEIMERFIDSK